MDKFEYKVRAEEIKSLIAQGDYEQAAEIADSIDWRRVKSVMMLCMVSDLYKVNRRYEDARNMLLLAYDRHPNGRAICYSLCELSIKMEEIVDAVEYYKEFVQIAPKDTGRYVLQYKLYEAQDVSLEERIAVLEELKRRDYREKWAYELAYLYHRVGLSTRCVEECDELILWFGDGKYVIKAMELKMLHQPLTPEQQQKYDYRFQPRHEQVQLREEADKEQAADGKESEQSREFDFQVKTVDVSQFNTINLQKELAEGLKEVLGEEEAAIAEPVIQPTPDTEVFFGETDEMEGIEAEENLFESGQRPRDPFEEALSMEPDGQISLVVPEIPQEEEQITGQMSIEDIMREWERLKKEAAFGRDIRVAVEAPVVEEYTEEEIAGDDSYEAEVPEMIEGDEAEDAGEPEVYVEIVEIEAVEETEEIEAVEEIEEIVEIEELEETGDEEYSEEKPEEAIPEEAAVEENIQEEYTEEEFDEVPEQTAEESVPVETEESEEVAEEQFEEEVPEEEPAEVPAEEPAEDQLVEEVPEEETAEELPQEVVEETEAAQPEETKEEVQDKPRVRSLSQEEKELFGSFIQNRAAGQKLVEALDKISLASYTGNVIVTGDEGIDTLNLAKNIIRDVQMTDSNFSGKTAKISGEALNNKKVATILDQLKNGALIIQKASDMNENTAAALYKGLQQESRGIVVVMEDSKKNINKFLEKNSQLKECFNARMDMEALSNDALVEFGKKYAKEKEYSIDEMGVLALHTRIEEMQSIDHAVTVMEVKEIIDEAIHHANKKNIKHFFDILFAKRYDEEDMVILRENDFI